MAKPRLLDAYTNKSDTITSVGTDYAEVGEWSDGNTSNEDRIGYFVSVDDSAPGITMVKATSTSNVRGVTIASSGFSANADPTMYDNNGNLLSKYAYVGFIGFAPVIDKGRCTVNQMCIPDDDGTAVPSNSNYGYQVIERKDANTVLILVEPHGDALHKMHENFQDGVDSIYDAVVAKGTTPSSKSLSDVVDSIGTLMPNPNSIEYDDPTYFWSDDLDRCVAIRTAQDGTGITQAESSNNITSTATGATCKTEGVRTYTANFINEAFVNQTKEKLTPKRNHNIQIYSGVKAFFEWDRCSSCSGIIQGFYDIEGNLLLELSNEMIEKNYSPSHTLIDSLDIDIDKIYRLRINSASIIGNYLMYGCSQLKRLITTVPIGNYAFANSGLVIAEVTSSTIGDYAFYSCSQLTNIVVNYQVNSIGEYAFAGTGLTEVVIPSEVSNIKNSAFQGINYIFYEGDASGMPWGAKNVVGGEPQYEWKNVEGSFVAELNPPVTGYIPARYGTRYGTESRRSTKILETSCSSDANPVSVHYTAIMDHPFFVKNPIAKTGQYTETRTDENVLHSIGFNSDGSTYCKTHTDILNPDYNTIENTYTLTSKGMSSMTLGAVVLGRTLYIEAEQLTGIQNYSTPYQPYFKYRNYINTIYIGKNIKHLCDGFYEILPYLKEYKVDPDNYFFTSCDGFLIDKERKLIAKCPRCKTYEVDSNGLTTLTITSMNLGIKGIGSYAFDYTKVDEIFLDENIESIEDYGFYTASSLKSIKSTSYTEEAKRTLTHIKKLGKSAFEGSGLETLSLGPLIKEIPDKLLYFCRNLTSVNLGSNIVKIGESALEGCSSLTNISCLPNTLKRIEAKAFYDTRIYSITIPDSVNFIEADAFYGITSVYYNGSAEGAPWGAKVINGYTDDQGILYDSAKTSIIDTRDLSVTSVTIPDGVTSIGDYAFKGYTGLTSITIPNSVTSIGSSAFQDCTGLTSITIPNSVTSIGNSAFYNCTGLTSITIPDGVTSIGNYAFSNCTKLTSVTIPDGVTSIGDYAFKGCTGLTSITIPDSVTSIGNSAFYNCPKLTSITIPNSVTSIGNSAFYNCTGLTSITIPNSVTSIGNYAFDYCTGLTSIDISDSVTSISSYAFSNCTKLTSITIPNSVTSIGSSAFQDCTGLTSITIPDSVTSIGSSAFRNCTGVTSITIPDSVTSISSYAFNNVPHIYYTGSATGSPWGAVAIN